MGFFRDGDLDELCLKHQKTQNQYERLMSRLRKTHSGIGGSSKHIKKNKKIGQYNNIA